VVCGELNLEIAFQDLEHLFRIDAKNDVTVFFIEHL
jgi:hypothetical protein